MIKRTKLIAAFALLFVCGAAMAQSFTRGSEVLFEDNLTNETVGKPPSKWTLQQGGAEIREVKGEKAITFTLGGGWYGNITPKLSAPLKNLPEGLITIEFDFLTPQHDNGKYAYLNYFLFFNNPADGGDKDHILMNTNSGKNATIESRWRLATGKWGHEYAHKQDLSRIGWHRAAISFNKGVMNVFIDGKHMFTAKDVPQPTLFVLYCHPDQKSYGTQWGFVRNIRITSDKPYMTAEEIAKKSGFTPLASGSEIIFEDKFANEKEGEEPSKWEIDIGEAEIMKFKGEKVLSVPQRVLMNPKMSSKTYLPENYTLEFDLYIAQENNGSWLFNLNEPKKDNEMVRIMLNADGGIGLMNLEWKTPDGKENNTMARFDMAAGWRRFSLSANKKGVNVYVDGVLVTAADNAARAGWFAAQLMYSKGKTNYIRNVRIAKSN